MHSFIHTVTKFTNLFFRSEYFFKDLNQIRKLEQGFNDATTDSFYDKSATEYRIMLESFSEVSQIIRLKTRKNVFPCHQYMLTRHVVRNKVFNDMCTPVRKRKRKLTDEEKKNPTVTVTATCRLYHKIYELLSKNTQRENVLKTGIQNTEQKENTMKAVQMFYADPPPLLRQSEPPPLLRQPDPYSHTHISMFSVLSYVST